MSIKRLKVSIAGVPYNIATDEDVVYTQKLAMEIDSKITAMMNGACISPDQAQVLVMLGYADDAKKAEKENEALKKQLKEYLADAAQAKSERDMLKRELMKLKKNFGEG